jgi:hypothetical protein
MNNTDTTTTLQPGDTLRFANEYRQLPVGSICAATGKAPWYKISDDHWAQPTLTHGVITRQASELLAEHREVLRIGENITTNTLAQDS